MSVVLGPYGFGLLAQSLTFSSFLSGLISLGTTKGLVRVLAIGGKTAVSQVLGTAVALVVGSSLVVGLSAGFFGRHIGKIVFNDPSLVHLVVLLVLWTAVVTVSGLFDSVLQAQKRILALSVKAVVISLIGLGLTVVFVVKFAVTGFFIGGVLTMFLSIVLVASIFSFRLTWQGFRAKVAKSLVSFGAVNLAGALVSSAASLAVRITISSRLGIEAVGFYTVALVLSGLPTSLVQSSINRYVFPSIAGLVGKRAGEVAVEQNNALRLTLFFATPLLMVVLIFGNLLIEVFYTSSFLPAVGILFVLVIGEFVKNIAWSFGSALLPKGNFRAYLFFEILYNVLFVFLTIFLLERHQLLAVAISYLISYLVFGIVLFGYEVVKRGFFIQSYNLVLMVKASLLVFFEGGVFLLILGQGERIVLGLVVILLWLLISVSRQEVGQLVSLVVAALSLQKERLR